MKAFVYTGPGPLIRRDYPDPQAGSGEIVVRVRTCGMCHTDVAIVQGHYFPRHKPPLILGHEIAGTVAESGTGVEHVKTGDRVIIYQCLTCGACDRCREGRPNLCREIKTLGLDIDGGYAEYIRVPAANAVKLPDSLSFSEGSIIVDALATAHHAVSKLHLERGETVAVFGAGVLGLNAVQIAANLFGARVVAVDVDPWKLDIALAKGAWRTLKAEKDRDTLAALRQIEVEIDAALEFIGTPETYRQAIESVRRGGRVVLVGAATQSAPLNPLRMFKDEVALTGSYTSVPSELPWLIEQVQSGRLAVKDMATHTFALNDINQGMDMLAGRREHALRAVVELP